MTETNIKLSDCGDVYVWGWNVNGQLGLPTGTMTTNPDTPTATCYCQSNNESSKSILEEHKFGDMVEDHDDAKLKNCQATCAEECSHLKIHACKRKIEGSDEESICKRQEMDSNLIDSLETGTAGRQDLFVEEKVFTQNLKHVSQSNKGSNISDCVSRIQSDDFDCEGIKFYQSIDCVQTQTVPYGLDLGDKMLVKTVSCGSRHTCILSGKISRLQVIVISNLNRLL